MVLEALEIPWDSCRIAGQATPQGAGAGVFSSPWISPSPGVSPLKRSSAEHRRRQGLESMKLQPFFLVVIACLGLGFSQVAGGAATDTQRCVSDDAVPIDIQGPYNGVIFARDGYAYFTIGDAVIRMLTVSFPDPVPNPGDW